MKRVLTVFAVIAAATLLNGCTKCSNDRPADAPPVMDAPPAGPADNATPPADGTGTGTGTEGTTAPGTGAGEGATGTGTGTGTEGGAGSGTTGH